MSNPTKPNNEGPRTIASHSTENLASVMTALIHARNFRKLEDYEEQLARDLTADIQKHIGINRLVPPPVRVPRSNQPPAVPPPVFPAVPPPGWERALPKGWKRITFSKGLRYHPSNMRWNGAGWVYVNPADLVAQPDDIVIQDGAGL